MSAHQAEFPIRVMARVLRVSASGYYAWRSWPASAHAQSDAAVLRRIRTTHAGSHGTYGAPRVHAELQAEGTAIARKRVARLMRQAGLRGVSRRRFPITTRREPTHRPANDLVGRVFTAPAPNLLWVADITYVPTAAGFLFLAVVLDAWSTGDIGRQLVAKLLDAGAPVRIIARNPDHLARSVRDRAEVFAGSHGDAAVLDKAFRGASALFWLTPPDPRAPSVEAAYVDFTRPAAAAMKAHGVPRVVSVTAIGRGSDLADKAGFVTGSLAMDDLIAATGVALRALAMPSFMDNILRQAAAIRDKGVFFSPISGDLRLPSVATRDIAALAARWLLDDRWTGQEDVAALGPEDISFDEMAAAMSEVLGKPVRFQQIGFDAYREQFLRFGMSNAMAQGMTDMARAKDGGIDLSVRRSADNTTPTRFRQWCEDTLRPAVSGQAA